MIIDCDTHLMPKDAFDRVAGTAAARKPTLKFNDAGLYVGADFPGSPPQLPGTSPLPAPGSGAMFKSLWDIRSRMEDYDTKLSIEQQVVLPQFSGWWSYLIEPELAAGMARSHNEAVLRLMKEYAGRILGVALVALQDVAGATKEMEWARDKGFSALVLDKVFPVKDHPYGEPLGSRRELWPFFRKAEQLNMPLYLHTVQHGHRISNVLPFQRDGLYVFAPQEGEMSLVSLFTSGLLDTFRKLQFVYTEAGTSFIKTLVRRLDKILEAPPVDYSDEEESPLTHRPSSRQEKSSGGREPFCPRVSSWKKISSRQVITSKTTSTSPSKRKNRNCRKRSSFLEPIAFCSPRTIPMMTRAGK
jgi:predicted TIM-barrel fold metal-dependent hydrolase